MNSSLESFSTELIFEVFEYLSPFDLFLSLTYLNGRFDAIIHSYPLRLNFRSISRSKFDYICRSLQPQQVIALVLSDENLPNQSQLFMKHFPHFKNQFTSLQSVTLIEAAATTLIDLPTSVSCLSIRKHDVYDDDDLNMREILVRQAKFLTHLKIDRIDALGYLNSQFPSLTHLIIDGGLFSEIDYVMGSSDFYEKDYQGIVQNLGCFITHLHLYIYNTKHRNWVINLEHLSKCLTHLTLHYFPVIEVSFKSIEQCLINLHRLTHFTIRASGTFDLIDGRRWEEFISKTAIIKFNFKFKCKTFDDNETSFLSSFRSPFWLKEKRWYVGCYKDTSNQSIFIYSIPRFRIHTIDYPSDSYPHSTTAPAHVEHRFFDMNRIEEFYCDTNQLITPMIRRFPPMNSLHLSGSSLLSLETLTSIFDLNQIQGLDVSEIDALTPVELHILINHCPRLKQLHMKYNSSFIVPLQIRHLVLDDDDDDNQPISVDALTRKILSVKTLEIRVTSKQMIIDIIDKLDHLENIVLFFDEDDDGRSSVYSDVTNDWLEQSTCRLNANNFTTRHSMDYFPIIYLSIGNGSNEK